MQYIRSAFDSSAFDSSKSPMSTSKTSTLTFRISPSLKNALRVAAEREHRSIANMVEMLIRAHCERYGIAIREGGRALAGSRTPVKRAR